MLSLRVQSRSERAFTRTDRPRACSPSTSTTSRGNPVARAQTSGEARGQQPGLLQRRLTHAYRARALALRAAVLHVGAAASLGGRAATSALQATRRPSSVSQTSERAPAPRRAQHRRTWVVSQQVCELPHGFELAQLCVRACVRASERASVRARESRVVRRKGDKKKNRVAQRRRRRFAACRPVRAAAATLRITTVVVVASARRRRRSPPPPPPPPLPPPPTRTHAAQKKKLRQAKLTPD